MDIRQAACHSVMSVLTHQEAAVQRHCLAYSITFPLFNDSNQRPDSQNNDYMKYAAQYTAATRKALSSNAASIFYRHIEELE